MRFKYIWLFISVFCLSFVAFAGNVYASTGTITGDSVRIRSSASTSGSVLGYLYLGYSVTVNDSGTSGSGCDSLWYNITYSGTTGYVCGEYLTIKNTSSSTTATSDCEKEMEAAGFPSSYWSGLCALKEAHPTWSFKAIETNLDWATVVEKESACGKSLIQTSNSEYKDSSCSVTDGSFVAASKTAVAYYMDPRNFLTEQYIFQFEYLQYDDDLATSYVSAVTNMLSGTSFYTYHTGLGNNLGDIINQAGKASNVSPIHIASRMYQELGTGTSLYNLYSGVYTEYDNAYYGYYNFFNIGVGTSCNNTYGATYCGLSYALSNGWNSVYNAIKGGADFLGTSYISVGQYTIYLQKFNVVPTKTSSLYIHQYMTNIMAPSSESKTMYNTYKNLGLLDSAFVFYIPVYSNMDDTISNSASGAEEDTSSSTDSSSTNTTAVSVSTVVVSAGYTYSATNISNISAGTTVSTLKSNLESINGSNTVTVYNSDGSSASGNLKTGQTVTIKNDNGNQTLTVVVKGDTSGDGKITVLDLLQVQKNILGTTTLSSASLLAADTSGDGKVTVLDLLQIQKSILNGTATI